MKITRFLFALLLLPIAIYASAQSEDAEILRPVYASYTIEAGSAHIADTYLTPLRYSGWQTNLRYDRLQAARFSPEKWVMKLDVAANVSRTVNPAGNSNIWYWGIDMKWGLMRRVWHHGGFYAMAGGGLDVNLGALYSARNGNNPVSAKAAVIVDFLGIAAWKGRIGRLPLTVSWQPSLPVTGAFFAPEYGELYYEIYLGDRRNLARAAWWGNYFRMDNLIAVDLKLGGTYLRLGYRNYVLSTKASHITSRIVTHTAVFGISGEWITLNPRKPLSAKAKIISAL